MKALVVYDSYFGNTEDIAIAIGNVLKEHMSVDIRRVSKLDPKRVKGIDFMVVGSPTRAFQATRKIKEFLKGITKEEYAHMKVIAFDTRMATEDTDSKMLNRMVKTFGYAAKPMGEIMKKRGAKLLLDPIGFYVKGTEGPLKAGEKERAATWIKEALQKELT
jgi:menaquinone-dependent protoporphyrinogen IX oxidase